MLGLRHPAVLLHRRVRLTVGVQPGHLAVRRDRGRERREWLGRRLDSLSSAAIGSFAIASTGGWQDWQTVPANIAATTGVHTLYLAFVSGQPADFVNLHWFTFS